MSVSHAIPAPTARETRRSLPAFTTSCTAGRERTASPAAPAATCSTGDRRTDRVDGGAGRDSALIDRGRDRVRRVERVR